MKRLCALFFVGLMSVNSLNAHASGLPTVDAAAIAQLSNQLLQMRQQYLLLKRMHASQTGSYARGKLGLDAALRSTYVLPGSWQDIVGKQRRGIYGAKKTQYEKLTAPLPGKAFRDGDGMTARSYQLSTDAVIAAMAGGEAVFEEVDVHLKNMRKFARRVDTTKNSKDALDLQNRIAAENGMLQTAMAKANVLASNMQAHLVHHQNQATALSHRYFNLLH